MNIHAPRPASKNKKLLEMLSLQQTATAIYKGEHMMIQTANDVMIGFWGKDRSIIGKPLIHAVPELKGQPFTGQLQNVWKTGIAYEAKAAPALLLVNGKLQTFNFDLTCRAVRNERGEVDCIIHTATDVTGKTIFDDSTVTVKKSDDLYKEQALTNKPGTIAGNNPEATIDIPGPPPVAGVKQDNESTDHLMRIFEQLPLAFCVLKGPNYIIELANNNMLKLWGRQAEVIGQPYAAINTKPDNKPFLKGLEDVYTTGKPYTAHEVKAHSAKEGHDGWGYYNFNYQPALNKDGATAEIFVIVNDVTELVLARHTTNLIDQQLGLAVDAANIGTWHINTQTRVFRYNAMLAKLLGYEGKEDMTYEQAIAQVTEDHRMQIMDETDKVIKHGGDYDIIYSQRRFNDGELIWLRCWGKANKDAAGKFTVFSGVVMDVTEQKQDEQRKNDFIGMVSHELKNPLTSINTNMQILQVKAIVAQDVFTTGILNKTVNQVKRMTALINGFLNVSHFGSGKIVIDRHQFSLDELIRETVAEISLIHPTHHITFWPCDPVTVNADRDKIGSVLSNLLGNAVKYSPKGNNVEVICGVQGSTAQVSVKDDGMGIKPEEVPKLFDRYYRGQGHQDISGFGIGLYLCDEIIRRHAGKIWVESQIGQGSTFYFSLPLNTLLNTGE